MLPFSLHGPKLFGNLILEVCGLRFLLSLEYHLLKSLNDPCVLIPTRITCHILFRSNVEVTDAGLDLSISPLLLTDEGEYRYSTLLTDVRLSTTSPSLPSSSLTKEDTL